MDDLIEWLNTSFPEFDFCRAQGAIELAFDNKTKQLTTDNERLRERVKDLSEAINTVKAQGISEAVYAVDWGTNDGFATCKTDDLLAHAQQLTEGE